MSTTTKTKIKPLSFELDPHESILLVLYEKQVIDINTKEIIERKSGSKKIILHNFSVGTDMNEYSSEIVSSCKLINPNKIDYLKSLLEKLKERLSTIDNNKMIENEKRETLELKEDLNILKKHENIRKSTELNSETKLLEEQRRQQEKEKLEKERLEKEKLDREEWERKREEEIREKIERETWQKQKELEMREKIEREMREKAESQLKVKTDQLEMERKELERQKEAEKQRELEKQQKEAEKQKEIETQKEAEKQKEIDRQKETEKEKLELERKAVLEKEKKRKNPKNEKRNKQMAAITDTNNFRDDTLMIEYGDNAITTREVAKMAKVEEYVEMLYEDSTELKVKGTMMLLQLVQDASQLPYFLENDTMIIALTRILAEDRKKSVDLVTNILEIFFCFSNFSSLHKVLLNNKIGDATMKVIDLEVRRYEFTMAEQKNKKPSSKILQFLSKQERLLYVSFYILLNLAEDLTIEVKMVNRGVLLYLLKTLERKNPNRQLLDDLHLLTITFLKKLSIFRENKIEMMEYNIVDNLAQFLPCENEDLMMAALRLLFNLSFVMTDSIAGLFPGLFECLRRPNFTSLVVRILYHVSSSPEERRRLAFTSIPIYIMQLILKNPKKQVDKELMALAINLSVDVRCAESICFSDDCFTQIMKRAHVSYDVWHLKLLRNMATHTNSPITELFKRYIHEIISMVVRQQNNPDSHDVLIELLGILSPLTFPDLPYADLIAQNNLVEFAVRFLMTGFAEDDIVLELIIWVGSWANDPRAGSLLANLRLLQCLQDLLIEKSHDDEIVIQTLFTIFKLILHDEPREIIITSETIIIAMLELYDATHPTIHRIVSNIFDVLLECGVEFREKILEKRFELYNREWLHVLAQQNLTPLINADDSQSFSNFESDRYYQHELQLHKMQMEQMAQVTGRNK